MIMATEVDSDIGEDKNFHTLEDFIFSRPGNPGLLFFENFNGQHSRDSDRDNFKLLRLIKNVTLNVEHLNKTNRSALLIS